MKKSDDFTIVIWKEGKYFVAQCLNVDVSSFGDSYEEALANINEAISLYMEDVNLKDITSIEMPAITLSKIHLNQAS